MAGYPLAFDSVDSSADRFSTIRQYHSGGANGDTYRVGSSIICDDVNHPRTVGFGICPGYEGAMGFRVSRGEEHLGQ